MPKLELGDLESVEKLKDINIPLLAPLRPRGLGDRLAGAFVHADVQAGTAADLSRRRGRQGGGRRDVRPVRVLRRCATRTACSRREFKHPLGKVSYHIPCHSRVQNVGQKTREALEWVPGTTVNTVERCAGHDGTFGVKREFYADLDEDRQARCSSAWPSLRPSTSARTARSPGAGSRRASPSRARRSRARRIR